MVERNDTSHLMEQQNQPLPAPSVDTDRRNGGRQFKRLNLNLKKGHNAAPIKQSRSAISNTSSELLIQDSKRESSTESLKDEIKVTLPIRRSQKRNNGLGMFLHKDP